MNILKILRQRQNKGVFKMKKIATNDSILYSKQAMEDGYDFSSFTKEEQIETERLYTNEQCFIDFSYSSHTMDLIKSDEKFFHFDKTWGFPETRDYFGYILKCIPSNFSYEEFYIEFLYTDFDIVKIKCRYDFSDPVCRGIKEFFNIETANPYQLDVGILEGRAVNFYVKNIEYRDGNSFSKIDSLYIFNDDEVKLINKMIDTMAEQCD